MLINRVKLLNLLSKMQMNKSYLETLNVVNFENNVISQTNNDIVIQSEIDATFEESFSLPINQLVLILSKLKDNEIELEIGDLIKIKTQKSEIEFTKEVVKYSYNNVGFNWIELPVNFIKGIKFTGKIIDPNNTRFIDSVFIDNNKIVSTNGKALVIYNLGDNFNKCFLKQNQINLLLKCSVDKYFIKDNLIYFKGEDDIIIYFNYITDLKFVDYEKIVMDNEKEIQFLDRFNLSDIEVNLSFLDENKMLRIEIDKKNIKVKSGNNNINIKTKLEINNNVDIKFGINSEYLLDFLKSDFSSSFKTFIDENKICFMNDDIKFITMLME